MIDPIYITDYGKAYLGDALDLLAYVPKDSVDLVITSPPFALQRKKEYGNEDQDEYVDWLFRFAEPIKRILKDSGSFVLDIGGAYKKGRPIRSLYNYKVLIRFCDEAGFHLAEEFFWFNPAKLPSPIEWVNKRKIRVKDSVNTIWWFSKMDFPKANIQNVLVPYSKRMKELLENKDSFYKPKKRPSGHDISIKFCNSNEGAIPPNLLQIANTESNSQYLRYCKLANAKPHPARFPMKIPEFFIKFLTEPNDMVVDIFAGSNTTGAVSEANHRNWMAFEKEQNYLATSAFYFLESISDGEVRSIYEELIQRDVKNVVLPQRKQIEILLH